MSEFVKVAKVSNLTPGKTLIVEYDDFEEVGLIYLENDGIYAISNICTHDDGPLLDGKLEGTCIICPRHGAKFDVKTGDYTLPAFAPVPRYEVKIEGEDILIAPIE